MTRVMMTSTKAGMALACTFLLTSGCGDTSGSQAATSSRVEPLQVELRANEVYTAIAGGPTEREASHFLSYIALNEDFEKCMANRGYDVKSTFTTLWSEYNPNATSGSWMGAMDRLPSTMALANADAERAESAEPEPGSQEVSEGYKSAASACDRDRGDTDVDLGNLPGVPAGSAELTGAFKRLIFDVDAELGPIEPYYACMADSGVELKESDQDADGWQALYVYLVDSMPQTPLAHEEPSAEWSGYLEFERLAISADRQCRGDKYERGLALLEPLLEDFEIQHSEEIKRLGRAWERTVSEAQDQGFDSQ